MRFDKIVRLHEIVYGKHKCVTVPCGQCPFKYTLDTQCAFVEIALKCCPPSEKNNWKLISDGIVDLAKAELTKIIFK